MSVEYKALMELIAYYNRILSDDSVCMQVVKDELVEIKEKYGDDDYLQKVVDRLWKL